MNARVLSSLCALLLRAGAPAAPGDVDLTYNPNPSARCYAPTLQPDGRAVLGGAYTTVGGVSRNYLARISTAGTLDAAFNPNSGGPSVYSIVVQPDGSLVFSGTFTTAGGVSRSRIAKVSAAGTLDAFNPNANGDVYNIAPQPDGRLIIGGTFTSVGGVLRNRVARLSASGGVDPGFNPNANNRVRTIALLPDGSMILAGDFTAVGGTARTGLAKLSSAGVLLPSFAPTFDAAAYTVALQPDGKILAGGAFSFVGSAPRSRIARLLPDGTVDGGFNLGANDLVRSFTIQTDGKIIISGNFTVVAGQTRNRFARLHPDGSLDMTFNPNANAIGWGASLQTDGRVLARGDFTTVGGLTRNYYARLQNDPATESVDLPSPARVEWLRGGASPEAVGVTAELSVNGGAAWSPLAPAIRIAGGWEFTGLSLPASGQIRLRARVSGGYGNGSSGLVETVRAYSFSALEVWRHTHFGTAASAGSAADNADPDKDGLENLVEFAFGLNPNTPDAAALPEWELEDDDYSLTFTRPAGVDGITYAAEYSTSMAPGSWTPAVNVSTPPAYHFLAPAVTQRLYLRVRVTMP